MSDHDILDYQDQITTHVKQPVRATHAFISMRADLTEDHGLGAMADVLYKAIERWESLDEKFKP
jgi:hypothetical protein